jgi:hypothetical protein
MVAVVAASGCTGHSEASLRGSVPTGSPSCALSDASFLPVGDFGSFVQYVSSQSKTPRYTGLGSGTSAPLWVRTFVGSRFVGALANRSLQSPFIEQERQQAAALGYNATKWPLTPLEGNVVQQTPGLLEVYQTHNAFSSTAGPGGLAQDIIQSDGGLGGSQTVMVKGPPLNPGAISYEFKGTMGNPGPGVEHVVGVGVTYHRVLAQLMFQGGARVTPDAVAGLVQQAAQRLANACGK